MPYMFVRMEDLVSPDLKVRAETIGSMHRFLGIEDPTYPMERLVRIFDRKLGVPAEETNPAALA
eukprot:8052358-Pyramimonas_sp.AAC.1